MLSLAEAMRRRGHEVRVLLPAFLGVEEPGVAAYSCASDGWLRPATAYIMEAFTLLRLSGRGPADVVYARTGPSVLPGTLARLAGARFVFEVNGDAFGERGWSGGRARAAASLAADWINCRLASAVVALTPGLAEMVRRRYGAAAAKVRIIPSAADISRVTPRETGPCREAVGLASNVPVVLFLGVLYEHQGVQTLLRAAPEILEAFPRTVFLVLGDGPHRAALESLAASLRIGAAVRFEGRVPFERIGTYLGAADVCAAPFTERRGETSPLKLYDYMAAGRAVVACDIPSIRPLARDSGALVLVPPDDPRALAHAIVDLLADPDRREALGAAGRAYAERAGSWERVADAVLAP